MNGTMNADEIAKIVANAVVQVMQQQQNNGTQSSSSTSNQNSTSIVAETLHAISGLAQSNTSSNTKTSVKFKSTPSSLQKIANSTKNERDEARPSNKVDVEIKPFTTVSTSLKTEKKIRLITILEVWHQTLPPLLEVRH